MNRTFFVVLFALALVAPATASTASRAAPRLGVLVVFDQLPAHELDRLAPYFVDGDFGGLRARGAARFDADYRYAVTETGPGHATLSTGANPPVHGVVANRWPGSDGGLEYVVSDPAMRVLGAPDAAGVGPRHLMAPTLADSLKLSTAGSGRVVTVAIKDRAATLTGGRSADLAIWYDSDVGRFTTSEAYASALPTWLDDAGRELPSASQREGRWSPLPTDRGAPLAIDDFAHEAERHGFGRSFPHDLASITSEPDRRKAYRGTPQAMSDLFTIALLAQEELALGDDDVPDLLVVGVSATDYVNHWFGPHSLESADMLRRADLALRSFLATLDERLGRNGYVLAVSADHGGTPIPERALAESGLGGRIQVLELEARIDAALQKLGVPKGAKSLVHPPHVFLPPGVPEAKRAAALDVTSAILESEPGIAHVYRVDGMDADHDPFVDAYRASMFAGRSGDLLVRQAPRIVFTWGTAEGTDHGTPYVFDRRVPVIVAGPGVARGRYSTVVDPRDVAPTLAFLLGIAPPDACEGRPVPAVGVEHVRRLVP